MSDHRFKQERELHEGPWGKGDKRRRRVDDRPAREGSIRPGPLSGPERLPLARRTRPRQVTLVRLALDVPAIQCSSRGLCGGRFQRRVAGAALALGMVSCTGAVPPQPSASPTVSRPGVGIRAQNAESLRVPARGEGVRWQPVIASPQRVPSPRESWLLAACGTPDAGLVRVAERLAARHRAGGTPVESGELAFALRVAGLPYVRPRSWILGAGGSEREWIVARMQRWLEGFRAPGERRCGAASVGVGRDQIVAVVVADVQADVARLPTRARLGQWQNLEARLLVDGDTPQVVLLGPVGPPRQVPSVLAGGAIRSAFSLDAPGSWLVQVLVSLDTGPQPVAELQIFVDVEPPKHFEDPAVPGEIPQAAELPGGVDMQASSSQEQQLLDLINRARVFERRAPVRLDSRLQRLATSHAEAMRRVGQLGHDVGQGNPQERLESADVPAEQAGENVAHADNLLRAHRALWASPSHRSNLLQDSFTSVGVGVVEDTDGSVWVCEFFALLAGS